MDATRTTRRDLDESAAAPAVPLARILEKVRSYWGFESLRPLQEEAIRATLQGRDTVVVLPTGGGKSLCYQVPPVLIDRPLLVVSPLISLMKDQVDGLRACGYPAGAVHSGLSGIEKDETLRGLRSGSLRLVFVSPERLLMPGFLDLIAQLDVRAFAVDEAHCISHWGHDFRREYRRLALLKQRFPNASVHAYTATATPRVRQDIALQLGLTDPLVLVGSFDRPNLTYRIVPRLDVYDQVIDVLRRHQGEGAIVYCLSRKDTEAMAEALQDSGIRARAYHAGLDGGERRRTQDAFAAESLDVVAATVAFGMGIDRSNVRCVIHATMPKSIEHYQQETGRAGRDGLEAECVLFYSAADAMRWESLITHSAAETDHPEQIIAAQMSLVEAMRRYCNAFRCRHRALVEHFGQSYTKNNCEACDVCVDESGATEDATETAQKILSSIARAQKNNEMGFGVTHTVDVLLGADTEGVRRWGHDRLSTYGILKGTPKKTLTHWVYQLLDQDLLTRTAGDRPVLELNDASWEVMRGQRTVRWTRAAVPVRDTRASLESWEGVDRGLFECLRGVRRQLAEQDGVPAFVILSDAALRDLARVRPTTIARLTQVHGIGEAKLTKLGQRLIDEIGDYCRAHGLSTDVATAPIAVARNDGAGTSRPGRAGRSRATKSQSKQAAFDMFAKGSSVDEVMVAVARARSTVAEYLSEFIATAAPASIERWVDEATYTAVARAAAGLEADRLKPIYERLEGRISYDEIRLVVTHLKLLGE